ncbi:hypothetical protein FRC12_000082 [Ceratobasidium sp. 428]|nr:hypothetical protein FRC12_000082 [Ceratobasidium sp. 428]
MSAVLNDKKAPDRPQEIPEHTAWGDELWGLLLNCWCHIPSERPTARDVRQHLQKLRHISKEAYAPGASGYGQ